ncbi:vWA domain-containing protein [Bifidobacterium adolescentis]|uniref:vWA domain-containing protein n=1 Tax=Bifidobacterium adolescentis TaxID=1680 RepID=UPI003BB63CE6
MKWMKDPLAGFISRCGARMGKFTALLVTIAMLAGTTGAGATAFADETVTDGGNVAAESAASQPESTQQSDAENAVGSDVADIAGQDVAGQSATDDDDAQCLTDDGESQQPSNEQAQSQLQSQSQPEQPSETMPEQRQPCDKTEQPNEQKEQERQAVRQPTAENADVPANGAAPAQDGDRNDHAGENRTDAVANGDAGATADDGKTGDADDADNDGNTAEDADDAEHIMRDRFTFNRKTVMRAARNVAVPQPDHTKSITYNNGGKYTLNLNVVGKDTRESHEVTEKIEVVLVLDTSGSMGYCMNGRQGGCSDTNPQRLAALKKAANSFIDATETTNDTIQDENSKVRIAIAQFGQTSGVVSSLTSDTAALKSSVSRLSANGATPADKGMAAARTALLRARPGAKKIVIFFADGVPTTQNTFSTRVANDAVQTALAMKSAGTLIYSIGIFEGANPEQQSFGNRENDQANQFMHAVSSNYPNATAYDEANWGTGGNLGYYKATNSADDLTKIFDDIQQEITTGSAYSGVSIVDELSEYAQADGVVWNMAGMRNFGGTTYYRVTGGVTLNVTNLPSGATPPVLERDYTLWYSDAGNGKIRVEFAGDYELLHNATYTLSYGMVPTDSAYARVNMVDGGINYDATGDAGTGTTSAGKPGFRSNASAQVCYTFDKQSACAAYQHPVLQVPSANVVVTKHWEGGMPASGATLRIDFMQGGASKLGKDLSEDDELPTGEWQYTFRGVMAGDYTVTEGNIAGYHAKGNVTSVPISITRADMWSAFDKGQTATYEASFTNVKETVAALPLSGASEGRTWLVVVGVTALVLLLAGIVGLALIGRGRP